MSAIESPLTGRVNVYNLLAASCAALARGLTLDEIAAAAPRLKQVPGRFQVVPGSAEAGFTVVVDYAHTDDALRNLIALARELVRGRGGRVITLFGCGGDRDRTQATEDGTGGGGGERLVVLTSDNPRSEEPMAIIEEALVGVRETATECIVEPDRAAAIAVAIRRRARETSCCLRARVTRRCRSCATGRFRSTMSRLQQSGSEGDCGEADAGPGGRLDSCRGRVLRRCRGVGVLDRLAHDWRRANCSSRCAASGWMGTIMWRRRWRTARWPRW